MNTWTFKEVLRENWHLTALLVGLITAGGYFQLRGDSIASGSPAAPQGESSAQASLATETPDRPSPQDEAKATIAKHKAQFDANPADKDAPVLLSAIGNLYRYKMADYPRAIQAYQLLLHDYPEWEGIRNTLLSLAVCYEQIGDREGVRDTYGRMLKKFPPESQEYQYAKDQLGR